jgi:hypothetical protein
MADPARLSDQLGREVHPDAFRFEPQGTRLLVVLDEVPEDYRGIKLPTEYTDRERMGAGTIMAAGPLAGDLSCPYPGGPIASPEELLYLHVLFGQYAGKPLRLDFIRDKEYEAGIIVLADRDVWAVEVPGEWDDAPEPETP